eukprot:GHVN01006415.1.p1 GENE.GHVN01006415.1~~GHVN01006415.1.p1  ORF type:complete len:522 (-),score=166.49 GHVN01006415.1:268-1833(-)
MRSLFKTPSMSSAHKTETTDKTDTTDNPEKGEASPTAVGLTATTEKTETKPGASVSSESTSHDAQPQGLTDPSVFATKVVLITGASSGIGRSLALKLLAKGGSTVYCCSRSTSAMTELTEKGGKVMMMDVTRDESVHSVVESVIAIEGRIDVLVCNAGYGAMGAVEAVPIDKIKQQFEVNVFGVARCLQAVLPSMRLKKAGRILITSSLVGHLSFAGIGWYAASKHAVNGMAVALRQEVKPLGIEVVLIEPGFVNTGFLETSVKELDDLTMTPMTPMEDYALIHKGLRQQLVDASTSSSSPDGTAQHMLSACLDKKPKLIYKTTTDSKMKSTLHSWVSDSLSDTYAMYALKRAAAKADNPATDPSKLGTGVSEVAEGGEKGKKVKKGKGKGKGKKGKGELSVTALVSGESGESKEGGERLGDEKDDEVEKGEGEMNQEAEEENKGVKEEDRKEVEVKEVSEGKEVNEVKGVSEMNEVKGVSETKEASEVEEAKKVPSTASEVSEAKKTKDSEKKGNTVSGM